jgi:hypothetical protein
LNVDQQPGTEAAADADDQSPADVHPGHPAGERCAGQVTDWLRYNNTQMCPKQSPRGPDISGGMGRVIQGCYVSSSLLLPGRQTFRVFSIRPLLFRDFDVLETDKPA